MHFLAERPLQQTSHFLSCRADEYTPTTLSATMATLHEVRLLGRWVPEFLHGLHMGESVVRSLLVREGTEGSKACIVPPCRSMLTSGCRKENDNGYPVLPPNTQNCGLLPYPILPPVCSEVIVPTVVCSSVHDTSRILADVHKLKSYVACRESVFSTLLTGDE